MTGQVAKCSHIIAPVVQALGFDFWGCELAQAGRHPCLRIYIDSEKGISLEDCALVSRQVGALLEVEDPLQGAYQLEVSSPGLERPLFNETHYQRFIDSKVKIKLRIPQNGRRNFTGLLKAVNEGKITSNKTANPFKVIATK